MTTMKDVALEAMEIGKLQAERIAQLEAENERLYRLIDAVAVNDDMKLTTVASSDSAE